MPLLSHLLFEFLMFHRALYFKRLEMTDFTGLVVSHLFLLFLDALDEFFCLLGSFAKEMKAIAPDLSFFLLNARRYS